MSLFWLKDGFMTVCIMWTSGGFCGRAWKNIFFRKHTYIIFRKQEGPMKFSSESPRVVAIPCQLHKQKEFADNTIRWELNFYVRAHTDLPHNAAWKKRASQKKLYLAKPSNKNNDSKLCLPWWCCNCSIIIVSLMSQGTFFQQHWFGKKILLLVVATYDSNTDCCY